MPEDPVEEWRETRGDQEGAQWEQKKSSMMSETSSGGARGTPVGTVRALGRLS